MIDLFLRKECVVIPRTQDGPDDEYDTPTWVDGDPVPALFHHEPISSEELASRTGGRVTERAWFHADTEIGRSYRVVAATGQGWEVDGPPRRWDHPIVRKYHYVEVDLVEVE